MLDAVDGGPRWRGRLIVVLGRQRVGKTTVANAIVQYCRELGAEIEVWNADQQNRSHTLSTFFPDALTPPPGGVVEGQLWIEHRLMELVRRGGFAVLDAGGGLTAFSNLVQDAPIVASLESHGIGLTACFCVGPEQADLDYLEQFAQGDLFLPRATAIVLNAGLVLSGRSAAGAFATVRENRVFKAASERGARVMVFPNLSCMAAVTDRGETFRQAMGSKHEPAIRPLSLFDRARVNRWWTREVPAFFEAFPREWLPIRDVDAHRALAAEAG